MRTTARTRQRIFGRTQDVADLPARLALGGAMIYHGLAKLRGEGPDQTGAFFESLGIRPGRPLAVATGLAETFAGAAAVLGIATRPAAIAVIVTQAMAIAKVHRPKGYDNTQGGMEYNLALISMALGLLAVGPGPVSAHAAARKAAKGQGARSLWHEVRPSTLERGLALLH
jgi:putative oxidoreductase